MVRSGPRRVPRTREARAFGKVLIPAALWSGTSAESGSGGVGSRFGEERRGDLRVPGGCLFWLLVSVVLSVTLTVMANLILTL